MSVENAARDVSGGSLFQVGRVGSLTVTAPAANPAVAPPQPPDTLPSDTSFFTGRERELDALLNRPESAPGQAVTVRSITGMAGIGKTTFAVHAAHRLADRFPGGRLFVRLHGHSQDRPPVDPDTALAALLLATGVEPRTLPPGTDERAALWRDRTSNRRLLLLLDDAADSAQVRPLLPGSGGALVIVTSRRRLTGLVDALPLPLDVLDPAESARLFVRLCGRSDLPPSDPGLGRLVELCASLPLAVGILAGQLRHHPNWLVDDLVTDLAQARGRLDLLRSEDVSVTAALDLSLRALPRRTRDFLVALARHPGTEFDVLAASALTGAEIAAARRLLGELYEHHLLAEPARGRYRFHDLVREYLCEQPGSAAPEGRGPGVGRLLDHYLYTARAADRLILGDRSPVGVPEVVTAPPVRDPEFADAAEARSWLSGESANLEASAWYAQRNGFHEHAVAIPAALFEFLRSSGDTTLSLELQRNAVRVASEHGRPLGLASALTDLGHVQSLTGKLGEARENLERALTLYRTEGQIRGTANAMFRLAIALRLTGEYAEARRLLAETLKIRERFENAQGIAQVLNQLGVLEIREGEHQKAITMHTRAVKLSRTAGDPLRVAFSLNHRGTAHAENGEWTSGLADFSEALELFGENGNRAGAARALLGIGSLQRLAGDLPAAIIHLDRALTEYQALGDRFGQANVLNHLGQVRTHTGAFRAGASALEAAAELFRSLGPHPGDVSSLIYLGLLQGNAGEHVSAATTLRQSLTRGGRNPSPFREAYTRCALGAALTALERIDEAEKNLSRALELYRRIGAAHGQAQVLHRFGVLRLAQEDPVAARSAFEEALATTRAEPLPLEEGLALEGMGLCLLEEGRHDEAYDHLLRAHGVLVGIGSHHARRTASVL